MDESCDQEATVKRNRDDTLVQLAAKVTDLITTYHYARRLKTPKGLTPLEYIRNIWTSEPDWCKRNPDDRLPGLNR